MRRKVLPLAAILLGAATAAVAGPDLDAEADQTAARQVEKFGKGYAARIDRDRRIIYVSALDEQHLRETIALLTAFADSFRRELALAEPAWYVTVVLPAADDYRKLKLPHADCRGFYDRSARRLVSIDRGRTLLHEFTHALHHADVSAAKQAHPPWVWEGLATLFEAVEIGPSGLRPRVDARLPVLQRAIREGKAIPLERLLKMGQRPFMQQAELAYAASRYVMLYLHEKGRLASWYAAYKDNFTRDPDGIEAFEAACGNRLFLVERQWKDWVGGLKVPLGETRSGQGRLGLEVRKTGQGVMVTELLAGGAAQRAGRIRVGDVILKFNGHEVSTPADLVGAIRAAGAGQTVPVSLRRNDRELTVLQPLAAAGGN